MAAQRLVATVVPPYLLPLGERLAIQAGDEERNGPARERRIRVDPWCGHASATTGVSCARYDQLVEVAAFKMWPETQRKRTQKRMALPDLSPPREDRRTESNCSNLAQKSTAFFRNRAPPSWLRRRTACRSPRERQKTRRQSKIQVCLIAGFRIRPGVERTAPDLQDPERLMHRCAGRNHYHSKAPEDLLRP